MPYIMLTYCYTAYLIVSNSGVTLLNVDIAQLYSYYIYFTTRSLKRAIYEYLILIYNNNYPMHMTHPSNSVTARYKALSLLMLKYSLLCGGNCLGTCPMVVLSICFEKSVAGIMCGVNVCSVIWTSADEEG